MTMVRRTGISVSVLTGCITHYLKGFLTGMLTLGSQIASAVGCHPLIMSHLKFKPYFVLAMLIDRQAVSGSEVTDLLHCQNGSTKLPLQHRLASPVSAWVWALRCSSSSSRSSVKSWLGKRGFVLFLWDLKTKEKFQSLLLFFTASFSFCYRHNHAFCYDSSSLVQFVERFASCLQAEPWLRYNCIHIKIILFGAQRVLRT